MGQESTLLMEIRVSGIPQLLLTDLQIIALEGASSWAKNLLQDQEFYLGFC